MVPQMDLKMILETSLAPVVEPRRVPLTEGLMAGGRRHILSLSHLSLRNSIVDLPVRHIFLAQTGSHSISFSLNSSIPSIPLRMLHSIIPKIDPM